MYLINPSISTAYNWEGKVMLYSKNDIIDIASDRSEALLDLGDKGILHRLNKVIEFLRRKDVQDVIGKDHNSNKDDSFFNETMTLKQTLDKKIEKNQKVFNLYDAIFLATLVIVFNDPLFKKLRGKSKITNPDEGFDKWFYSFNHALSEFDDLLKEELPKIKNSSSLETTKYNFEFIIHKFSTSSLVLKYTNEMTNTINSIMTIFSSLPEKEKAELYEKKLARYINTINNRMEKYVDELAKNSPESFEELKLNVRLDHDPQMPEKIKEFILKKSK